MSGLLFTVRPMEPADLRFVRETTLKVAMPRGGNWTEYETMHGAGLDRWLELDSTLTVVADAGGGLLLGFASIGLMLPHLPSWRTELTMIYVKHALRGNGIGLALLGATRAAVDAESGKLRVLRPTPSFRKWAALHRIAWTDE